MRSQYSRALCRGSSLSFLGLAYVLYYCVKLIGKRPFNLTFSEFLGVLGKFGLVWEKFEIFKSKNRKNEPNNLILNLFQK